MATATLVVLAGVPIKGGSPVDPIVSVDRTGTAAGEKMLVTGAGWPGGAVLLVELCGHGGLNGSVDCDVAGQRTAGVGPSGAFSVELTVARPPSPCPCVVKATDQASQIAATTPIAVAGLPTVPITSADGPAAGGLEIASVGISGGGRWAELFGAGGRRVLEITLVNTGPTTIQSPDVSVAWGTGERPDGFVPPPEVAPMEPGDRQTLTVPLNRPALTLGEQTAVVEILGIDGQVSATAHTSGYPWGLLAIALIALQLLLLRVRNRVRARLRRATEPVRQEHAGEEAALAVPEARGSTGGASGATTHGELVAVPEATETIDLRPLMRWEPPLALHNGLGHALERSTVVDAERIRDEVHELHLQARLAQQHAVSRSEALVDASRSRIEEIEQLADQRLQESTRHLAEALAVLDAARVKAGEVVKTAEADAEAARHQQLADRETVRRVLAEIEVQHRDLVETASREIDHVVDALEERLRALHPGNPSPGEMRTALPPSSAPLSIATPRPPHIGSFDAQLASAIERALASTLGDSDSSELPT